MWETLKRGTDQQCPFLGSQRYILLFVKYVFIVRVFAHVRVCCSFRESLLSSQHVGSCIGMDGLH